MSNQLISYVSFGEQTQYGDLLIVNAAFAFYPSGHESWISQPLLVTPTSPITFNFIDDFVELASVRLDFTPLQRPITSLSLSDFSSFGDLSIRNTAQVFNPVAISAIAPSVVKVLTSPPISFDLTAVDVATPAIHLTFDGASVVTLSGFSTTTFGLPLFPHSIDFAGEGVDAYAQRTFFVQPRPPFVFDFVDTSPAVQAIHLTFTGELVNRLYGLDSFSSGYTKVENAALGVLFLGVGDTLNFGAKLVVSKNAVARNIEFNLFYGPATAVPAIQFSFADGRTFIVDGIHVPTTFGYLSITHRLRIAPTGYESLIFGATEYLGGDKVTLPQSFDSLEVGLPDVSYPRIRLIGTKFEAYGEFAVVHYVIPTDQQVVFDGTEDVRWGVIDLSHFLRYLTNLSAGAHVTISQLYVSRSPRYIDFDGAFLHTFIPGFPVVGRPKRIELVSFVEQSKYGTFVVDIVTIDPIGIDSTIISPIDIRNNARVVTIGKLDSSTFGQFYFNNPQYIDFTLYATIQDTPFGVPYVRNRNVIVQPAGSVFTRFASSFADVVYAGIAFSIDGVDSFVTSAFPNYFSVTHFVRNIFVNGVDVGFASNRFAIFLTGRAFRPDSAGDSLTVSDIDVENLRTISRLTGADVSLLEAVRVSFTPIVTQLYSSRESLFVGTPFISFDPQIIAPAPLDSFAFTDVKSLVLPPQTIKPFNAREFSQYGNLTAIVRGIWPRGKTMTEWPPYNFVIDLWTKYAVFNGVDALLCGRVVLRDSTQYIMFMRLSKTIVSQNLRVWNVLPNPPSEQMFAVRGDDVFKAGSVRTWFPMIAFKGFVTATSGTYKISSNVIKFANLSYDSISMTSFGTPWLTGGFNGISLDSNESNGLMTQLGTLRVTPHTIWMRLDAPEQAIRNHGGIGYEIVNYIDTPNNTQFPLFGIFSARGGTHTAHFEGVDFSAVNNLANVESTIRYTYPTPSQFSRFGYFRIVAPRTKTIDFSYCGEDVSVVGAPYVELYDKSVVLQSTTPLAFGNTVVRNWIQIAQVSGKSYTVFGDNNPLIYHYPRGPKMQGYDATQFGTTWVDYYVRYSHVSGFDSLATYSTDYFQRMRVENKTRYVKSYPGNRFSMYGTFNVAGLPATVLMYGTCPPCVPSVKVVASLHRTVDVASVGNVTSVSPVVVYRSTDIAFIYPPTSDRASVVYPAIHLSFGSDARPIRMWGSACEQTGQVDVYNTASSLFVESVDSFRVGRMRVVSDRVLFDLSATASGTPPIELVFGI